MSKLQMYAPFSKVVTTEDNGREVWGFATLERVDKANEIADFEGTVKAFEDWSNEITKNSQGKSLGNIREMHQPKAVAKLIHWEPSETTVTNEDGTEEVVKGIYVGTKIPPSQTETIEKVDDGILTGFSIGGGYAKRWKDIEKGAMRFIPKLTELSYVDNPCVEGASFTMIKAAITEEGPVEAEVFEPMEKHAKGSFEDLSCRISNACEAKFKGPASYWDGYVIATFPDHVIVRDWCQDCFWDIPYTEGEDGSIELGEAKQVEKVESFVPVEAMKMYKAAEADHLQKKEEEALAKRKEMGTTTASSDTETIVQVLNGKHDTGAINLAPQTSVLVKRKEMETEMNPEELVKSLIADAMKAANGEQVGSRKWEEYDKDTLNKAAVLLEAAIQHVDEVAKREQQEAEAGEKDDEKDAAVLKSAKEVLSHILDEVKKVAAGEQAEKGNEQKPSDDEEAKKAAEAEELQKRNVAISKQRKAHLHHAQKHLQAAIDGTQYTDADHAEFEAQMGDQEASGMEQETNAEKGSFFGDLRKGIATDVSEALNKFDGLGELAKAADLSKAVEAINGVAKSMESVLERLESMEKRLKTIEEQPIQGGPISNPSAVTKLYQMGQQQDPVNKDAMRQEVYQELLKSEEIPLGARQVLAKNMALQSHPLAKR